MADVVVTGANAIDIIYPSGSDGIAAFLSPPSLAVVANSDGTSPVLTQAASTLTIMRGGTDISALYSLVCTPSAGITGSLTDKTYTVSGMANDTESVTFVASRSGYSDITAVFYLTKVRKSTDATTSAKGIVELATDGETAAGVVVQGNDTRLTATATQTAGSRVLYNAAAGLNANSISFPSTQVASSDPNTLDDYEEGDWTGAFVPETGTITMSLVTGAYVRKGREVTVTGNFSVASVDTAGGALTVTGLPFTVGNATKYRAALSVFASAMASTFNSQLCGRATMNTTTLSLTYVTAGSSATDTANYLKAGSTITIACSYFV